MTRGEEMTRAAAHLIERDLSDYVWNENLLAFIQGVEFSGDPARTFSPLTDPCDAFVLEAYLPISVRCEYRDGLLAMCASTPRHGCTDLGYMRTAKPYLVGDVLSVRMFVVTQFAELIYLAEGGNDR